MGGRGPGRLTRVTHGPEGQTDNDTVAPVTSARRTPSDTPGRVGTTHLWGRGGRATHLRRGWYGGRGWVLVSGRMVESISK